MNRGVRWQLWTVDISGGCLCLASLLTGSWLLLASGDRSRESKATLIARGHDARRTLAAMRSERDRQAQLLENYEQELLHNNGLPVRAPVEEYFQMLAQVADECGLRVLRHEPLTSRFYTGLLEERYAYHVSGATPDLLRFLRAIESSEYWADVGYLQLNSGRGDPRDARDARTAVLTISVFSALEPEEASADG